MKSKYIILVIATALMFGACEDELTLSPLDTISDDSFWKSEEDFKKAATDFYHWLGTADNGLKDQDSDITVGGQRNTVSAGTYIAGANSNTWNDSYSRIRQTCRLIEKYDAASEDLKIDAGRYAAEARFFRARAYFELVKVFGDVPLITKSLEINSPELFSARTPRKEVVDFMMKDLEWAVPKLMKQSELASNENGRVTRGAALALKTRIGLFEGTWSKFHKTGEANGYLTKCIDAARDLIKLGDYDVYKHADGPNESYYNLFIEGGQDSRESILARKYSKTLEISHNTTRWVDTHHNTPTKKLADMYLCTNGLPIEESKGLFKGYETNDSEYENRDPRMKQTFVIPGESVTWNETPRVYEFIIGGGSNGPTKGGYLPKKYLSGTKDAAAGKCYFDIMEFRYSEVLLNMAEALFERDGKISDSDLDVTINKLRERVGMPKLTNAFTTTNGLDMRIEIRRERTIELAYEGFRHTDLRRWKTAEVELPKPLLGVKFVGTEWPKTGKNSDLVVGKDVQVNGDGFIIADGEGRKFEQKHYLFPLPLNQLQLNENLKQNPGW